MVCVCVCVCGVDVCVHACVHSCVHACVHSCVHACMCACVCALARFCARAAWNGRFSLWSWVLIDSQPYIPPLVSIFKGMAWAMRETVGKCKGGIGRKVQFICVLIFIQYLLSKLK